MNESFETELGAPVEYIPPDLKAAAVVEGSALCLSGGGYRAMLFHTGALWRLYEAGILEKLDRISSVSGGSIASAVLGMHWSKLSFRPEVVRDDFLPFVVGPLRRLASKTIDTTSVVEGALLPGSANDKIAAAYRKYVFGERTLQDLPDRPRFVFNATNVQSGALWRFMKPYMRDWRVGEVKNPTLELAFVVAASSAFPPFLSPAYLEVDVLSYTPDSGDDLQRVPFTTDVFLTDGGVYDNLGLETAWKKYGTIFVSDAGGKMNPEPEPKRDWGRHTYRVLTLIDNQVRNLRKRQVMSSLVRGVRRGAFWDTRLNLEVLDVEDKLECEFKRTAELANLSTRLRRLDDEIHERLINWGYAASDAMLRKHYDPKIKPPVGFPYPATMV